VTEEGLTMIQPAGYCTSYSGSDVSSQDGVSEKGFIVDLIAFCSFGIEKSVSIMKNV
jgi:hypothetical protein